MRKSSAPRKLSPDVSRRLSDSRRQSAALTLREIFKDTHPAIIDRETFALVQELRKHRRRPPKRG